MNMDPEQSHAPLSIRVLMVEDNDADARLVAELLREVQAYRFTITHTTSLSAAFDALQSAPLDVLLLDLSLPDGHGLQTFVDLQRTRPDLPIVILSGLDDEALSLEAVQRGAQDYLVKGRGDGHAISRALMYAIERKRAEEGLTQLANFDPLTGLANRSLFQDRLQQTLERATRNQTLAALLYLDLDHFKDINDTLGHDAGDALLQGVADRLKSNVRASDTVARLGGDEFAIILENISRPEDAATIAEKIITAMARSFSLLEHDRFVTTSIGLALYPSHARDADNLRRHADTALYSAKRAGRSNYQVFSSVTSLEAMDEAALLAELADAVARQELALLYHPRSGQRDGVLDGVEAELHWPVPARCVMSAGDLWPLLEEAGLSGSVANWMLRRVCADHRSWLDSVATPLSVLLPVSPRQFRSKDFVSNVMMALQESSMVPRYLILGVAEDTLMADPGASAAILRALDFVGVQFSLIGYGTGASSLKILRELPLRAMQVAPTFTQDVHRDNALSELARAIVGVGHSLGLRVTACGVSDREQASVLHAHGYDELQGPLIGAAVVSNDIPSHIQTSLAASRRGSTNDTELDCGSTVRLMHGTGN